MPGPRDERADPPKVDEVRAMGAQEAAGGQEAVEAVERRPDPVGPAVRVDHARPRAGLDEADRLRGQSRTVVGGRDDDPGDRDAIAGRGGGALAAQALFTSRVVLTARMPEPGAHAPHRLAHTGRRKRLEQVVGGVKVERRNRVVCVARRKDHGHAGPQVPGDLEAVGLRHEDVEAYEIRPKPAHRLQDLAARCALGQRLHLTGVEQRAQVPQGAGFVIGDDRAQDVGPALHRLTAPPEADPANPAAQRHARGGRVQRSPAR